MCCYGSFGLWYTLHAMPNAYRNKLIFCTDRPAPVDICDLHRNCRNRQLRCKKKTSRRKTHRILNRYT